MNKDFIPLYSETVRASHLSGVPWILYMQRMQPVWLKAHLQLYGDHAMGSTKMKPGFLALM